MLPKTMKAVQYFEYGEPSVLKYLDVPLPEMGECDVLVKVKATSVNWFDVKMRRGQIPQIPGRDPFPIPFQLGRDVAGEVAAVGARVTRFKVGDRVVGMPHPACGQCEMCLRDFDFLCVNIKVPGHQTPGGYAEYISRPETQVLPAPDGVPWEKLASCLWSYACVWNIISRRGKLYPGQSVLITGASGGLGTAAVQLARMVGASKIIGTEASPERAEKLKKLGADHIVNYEDEDAAEQVKALTNGMGVELVIDFVGGEMFVLGLKSLCLNGTIVNVAGEEWTNSIPMRMLTVMLLHRYVTILGVRGAKRIDDYKILEFLGAGKIDPVIDQVIPLSEAIKAHEILESRQQFGKIVLVP